MIQEKGLKQSWLANQIGISPEMLSAILVGRKQPSKPVYKLLSLKLGFDESEFLLPSKDKIVMK